MILLKSVVSFVFVFVTVEATNGCCEMPIEDVVCPDDKFNGGATVRGLICCDTEGDAPAGDNIPMCVKQDIFTSHDGVRPDVTTGTISGATDDHSAGSAGGHGIQPPGAFATDLLGHKWAAIEYNNRGTMVGPVEGSTITFRMEGNGRFSGDAGCNDMFGDYSDLTSSSFIISGDVGWTEMGCERQDIMQQELDYFSNFRVGHLINWVIDDDGILTLKDETTGDDIGIFAPPASSGTNGNNPLSPTTLDPTKSPSTGGAIVGISNNGKEVLNYDFVGSASCSGSVISGPHPTIKTRFPEGDVEDCGDFCIHFRPEGEAFRGFTWYSAEQHMFQGECRCLFDIGVDLGAILSKYAGDVSPVFTCETWWGTGEVTTNGVEDGAYCYKVSDFTQAPTSSSVPTLTPRPTTSTPTKSPSIAGGSPINGYEYGGDQCSFVCDGCTYARIDSMGVPDVESCAEECNRYRSIGKFKGFSFEQHVFYASINSNKCTCVFEDGSYIFDTTIESGPYSGGGYAIGWQGPQGHNDVPTYEAYCYEVSRSVSESMEMQFDGYTFLGLGACQDADGEGYSYIQRVAEFPNAEACATQECERFGNMEEYRGFEYSVARRCTCLFDESPAVPNDPNDPKYVEKKDSGNGVVVGVSGTPGTWCYKVEEQKPSRAPVSNWNDGIDLDSVGEEGDSVQPGSGSSEVYNPSQSVSEEGNEELASGSSGVYDSSTSTRPTSISEGDREQQTTIPSEAPSASPTTKPTVMPSYTYDEDLMDPSNKGLMTSCHLGGAIVAAVGLLIGCFSE